MAKDEKEKPEEIPWTPDKPLGDEDDEKETQRRAQAEARKAYLIGQYSADPKKTKKGERTKLFG